MFIKILKNKIGDGKPILISEIFSIFSDYSKAQIYRFIKDALYNKELVKYTAGVYYIPKAGTLGLKSITADEVAEKKYLGDDNSKYGVYGGIAVLNQFQMTTQLPANMVIITNNESSRCRQVMINNRMFILKHSRFEINNSNASTYQLLQLFNEIKKDEDINNFTKELVVAYIKNNNIKIDDMLKLSLSFPLQTLKNIIRSGIINEIA